MAENAVTGALPDRLAGTETEKNLHTALSGEAQAYLRYKWFEKKAHKDGLIEVERLFSATAANEMEHAEIWFKYLGGISSTEQNLDTAAAGEQFEWESMYAEFERTARAEGFDTIADLFARIASVEKQHEANYREAHTRLRDGKMFHSESESTKWICLNCGYVVEGKEPPMVCPACSHPQGYFQEKTEK